MHFEIEFVSTNHFETQWISRLFLFGQICAQNFRCEFLPKLEASGSRNPKNLKNFRINGSVWQRQSQRNSANHLTRRVDLQIERISGKQHGYCKSFYWINRACERAAESQKRRSQLWFVLYQIGQLDALQTPGGRCACLATLHATDYKCPNKVRSNVSLPKFVEGERNGSARPVFRQWVRWPF